MPLMQRRDNIVYPVGRMCILSRSVKRFRIRIRNVLFDKKKKYLFIQFLTVTVGQGDTP